MDAAALFDSLFEADKYPIAPSDAFDARYSLLPPPPPTYVSSLTPSTVRGRLPDFDTTDFPATAARAWAQRLFFFDLTRAWPHLYFTTACIGLLVLIVGAIWARRIWERSWWLLRVVKKPNGTLVVPNSLITYTTCTGVFGVLLIALIWELFEWNVNFQRPRTWYLWLLLVWTPLFSAVHLASWGLFHSLPNVFTSSASGDTSAKHRSWLFRCMTSPTTLNFLGGILPFIQALSVIGPAVAAHIRYSHALDGYYEWRERYMNATQVNQEMLQDIQRVWYTLLSSHYIASVTFLVWTTWAVLLFLVWSTLNYRLMAVISSQLRHLRQVGRRHAEQAATLQAREQAAPVTDHPSRAGRPLDHAQVTSARGVAFSGEPNEIIKEESDGTFNKTESDVLASEQGETAMGGKEDPLSLGSNGDSDVERQSRWRTRLRGGLPPYSRRGSALLPEERGESEEDEHFTAAQIAADEPTATFFPPVKPSRIVRRQAPRMRGRTSQGNTKAQRYLRSVLVHVTIQAVAVTPAILGFAAVACWLGLQILPSFENPALYFGRTASTALIWMAWMSNIGGTITLVAIAQRTYEPVLHFGLVNAGGSGSQSSGAKRQAAGSAEGSKGSKGRRMRNGRPISRIMNAASRSNEHADEAADNGYGVTYTTFFESETIQRPAKSFPHGGSGLQRNESISSDGSAIRRASDKGDASLEQKSHNQDRAAAAAVGLGIGKVGSMSSFHQRSPVQPANKKSIARFAAAPLPATPSQAHVDGKRARRGAHEEDAQQATELHDMSPRSAGTPHSPRDDLSANGSMAGRPSGSALHSHLRTGSNGMKRRTERRAQSPVLQLQQSLDVQSAVHDHGSRFTGAQPARSEVRSGRGRGSSSLELNIEGDDPKTSDDDAEGDSYYGPRRGSNLSSDALARHAGSRYFASERRGSAASRTAGSSSDRHAPSLIYAAPTAAGSPGSRAKPNAVNVHRPGSSSSRLSDMNDPPLTAPTGLVPAPRRKAPGRPSSARRVPSSDSASQLHAASSAHPLSPALATDGAARQREEEQTAPRQAGPAQTAHLAISRQAPHSSPTFGILTPSQEPLEDHAVRGHPETHPAPAFDEESDNEPGYARAY